MGQELRLCISDAVTRVEAIDILIVVTFGFQHTGHVIVRLYPVVHPIPHDVRVEVITVADRHPNAKRLPRDVNGDGPLVVDRMRFHDQRFGVLTDGSREWTRSARLTQLQTRRIYLR